MFGALIFGEGEDGDFYYYRYTDNDRTIFGIIGKKYVKSIVPSKKSTLQEYESLPINRHYFCNKPVLIERSHKEGIIKGFFDFRNDDYQNVRIQPFTYSEVQLEFGGAIRISEICKIEELSD